MGFRLVWRTCVWYAEGVNKELLDEQIGVLAGHLHAATSRFVDMVATFDDSQDWYGVGMRSCAHWVTIATGVDLWTAREMVRVGHALRDLPLIHEAFAAGRLSFDKVRALTRVATSDDEAIWLELALEASGSQLARICHQYRRAIAVDDPRRAALQLARRRLVSWWLDEDGMLALYATLPPEEGRLVLNAIESAVSRSLAHEKAAGEPGAEDPCVVDEPDHPHGARRADALVRICERWLYDVFSATKMPPARPRTALVVHVDVDTLSGADADGRCHIEDGPAVPLGVARRLGCDGDLVTVLERDGVPLHVGRSRRVVSGRTRRLLQLRDQGCRYPGCGVPADDTEGHHVVHWADGGWTELANLVSLCRFHHHRHHEGAFRIVGGDEGAAARGDFRFETADGRVIGVRRTGVGADHAALRDSVPLGAGITPTTPAAGSGGASFDLDHTIVVVAGNIANAAARRRAEQPSGP